MTFSHERVITICCKPGVIVNKYCQCILIVFLNKSKNQNPFEFTVAEATLFRFKKTKKALADLYISIIIEMYF